MDNDSAQGNSSNGYAMEVLFTHHHMAHVALFCFILSSLIIGLPLVWNVLWHLRIATGASGRGVLRLLLLQQQINLFCIPAICLQLYIVAYPSTSMPTLVCLTWEILLLIVSTNGTIGHLTVALGRLFYLHQDTVTFINEESVFMYLTWIHPALSGIIVSMLLGENFFDSNKSNTSLFFYSSCSKIEFLKEEFNMSIAYNIFNVSSIAIVSITAFTHILLQRKHKQLKEQMTDGTMVIIYNKDGTSISRRAEDKLLRKKLWRHERTVVTPKASQLSFIVRLLGIPFSGILFLIASSSGLPPWAQFFFFTIFSQVFLQNNIVETIYSPKLHNSLIEYFQTRRQAYVVNV